MDVELENAFTASSSVGKERRIRGLRDHLTPEMVKGRETEATLVELFSELLTGVKEVRLAPRGSVADDVWKVDICLYTHLQKAHLFQVKSSKDAADRALLEYPDVPVIWVDVANPQHRLGVLYEMVQWTKRSVDVSMYVPKALAARDRALRSNKRKMDEVTTKCLFSTPELKVLELLLLIRRSSDGLYYLR
jgi:hypothetical protein